MKINGTALKTMEDGTQAISCTLNGSRLTLRRHTDSYGVAIETPTARFDRRFGDWRRAALAFSMLFHTERCLSRLEGDV